MDAHEDVMTTFAHFWLTVWLTIEYGSHAVIDVGIWGLDYDGDSLLYQEVF